MISLLRYRIPLRSLALAATLFTASLSLADQGEKHAGEPHGRPLQASRVNALWQTECSACHIAFAPGLLPAESWRKVMAGLNQHFGSDASLGPSETRSISEFLVSNAANRWHAPTAPERITETVWFQRKHASHEVRPDIWKRASIKSPANCAACHPDAAKGDFEEDRIRIPH